MKKEKRCIKFPSIEQFNNLVFNINRHTSFVGLNENGEAVHDETKPKLVVTALGSVKLHGTNFGFSRNEIDGYWFQSRTGIITPTSDNAGAAFLGESNKDIWLSLVNQVKEKEGIDLTNNTITIFGEFVGKGIQKGVGITNLDKSVFIFGVKVSPFEVEGLEKQAPSYWVDHSYLKAPEHKIYNILDYPTYSIKVDFNNPQEALDKITEMVISVEDECPVSKAFGFPNTIGEGLVFSFEFEGNRHYWKSKGLKHQANFKKNNNLQPKEISSDEIQREIFVKEITEKVCPPWRLEQMLSETFDIINGGMLDVKKLGIYIKNVINDALKEELLTLSEVGVDPKEINKHITELARIYFFENYNKGLNLK